MARFESGSGYPQAEHEDVIMDAWYHPSRCPGCRWPRISAPFWPKHFRTFLATCFRDFPATAATRAKMLTVAFQWLPSSFSSSAVTALDDTVRSVG
jgi:hypothetical protein